MKLLLTVLSTLLITSGCISPSYHQEKLFEARNQEIKYAQELATRVKEKDILPSDMYWLLLSRAQLNRLEMIYQKRLVK